MRARRFALLAFVGVLVAALLSLPAVSTSYKHGVCTSVEQVYGSVETSLTAADLSDLNIEVGDHVAVVLAKTGLDLEMPCIDIDDLFPSLPLGVPGLALIGNTVYITGWYTNVSREFEIDENDAFILRLLRKGSYLSTIKQRAVKTRTLRSDCSSDEEFANFREVSCGHIMSGVLYRSSHPGNADVPDRSRFVKTLVKQVGIQTIINVGTSSEDPQQEYSDCAYCDACSSVGGLLARNIGLAVTWSRFKEELREVLEFIIDHAPPYLIHCKLGQDRTGITIAILESLAGASYQEVVDDYALSFENRYGITKIHLLRGEVEEQLLSKLRDMNGGVALSTGSPGTVNSLQEVVIDYLHDDVGLSHQQIEALRTSLTG